MLALRAAWAAYVDGWARVLKAPSLLAGLSGALAVALLLHDRWPSGPELKTVLGFAAMAGPLGMVGLTQLGAGAGNAAALALFVLGPALAGGVVDRYARQRPLDARTFWGVSGELLFRLLRLNALAVAVFLLGIGVAWRITPWIVPDGHDIVRVIRVYERMFVGVAAILLVIWECARVRLVVERRRSVVFALVAGWRFMVRHLGQVLALTVLLAATFWPAWALDAWVRPYAVAATLTGLAMLVAALVSSAALTSLFQASLAHARYVAPPRLVWPDSPAIETLGGPRDFPPGV